MPTHSRAQRATDTQSRHAAPGLSSPPARSTPFVRAATQSGGSALDRKTQNEMSARFGHDFSQVRIHTDSRAEESAEAMGANAFALGSDIVFGAGQYTPGSPATERLLAHELTHVVQQSQFGPGDWGRASAGGDASEREADALAVEVAAGRAVDVRSAPGAALARDARGNGQGLMPSGPASPWQAFDENPIWDFATNDAVSGGVGLTQEKLNQMHKTEAGGAISRENAMQDEFQTRDIGDRHGWSPNESGTVEEIGAQKRLWKAGADLEDAENVAQGGRSALQDGNSALQVERTIENTASRFSPALKVAQRVGRVLSPFGVYSDYNGMRDSWAKGEHADAVAAGAGLVSSTIGTVDAIGAGLTWAGAAGGGAAGGVAAGAAAGAGGAFSSVASALNPVGAVAGSAAGGYAFGKLLLGGANDHAVNKNIFHDGNDTTEEAADTGLSVRNDINKHLPDSLSFLGTGIGGIAAIESSWGTAAYSGAHAVGSGIKNGAGWLWDHTFGDSGPSDKEMAANQKRIDASAHNEEAMPPGTGTGSSVGAGDATVASHAQAAVATVDAAAADAAACPGRA